MREFFQGWRRKMGFAALLLVGIFTSGCFQSLLYHDTLTFFSRPFTTDSLMHDDRLLMWARTHEDILHAASFFPKWERVDVSDVPRLTEDNAQIEWSLRYCRFYVGKSKDGRVKIWIVPYEAIIFPLLLISGFLLLLPPEIQLKRKSTNRLRIKEHEA